MTNYKETIKKSIIGGIVFSITLAGVAFAAVIGDIYQPVANGDTISVDWFKQVNEKLKFIDTRFTTTCSKPDDLGKLGPDGTICTIYKGRFSRDDADQWCGRRYGSIYNVYVYNVFSRYVNTTVLTGNYIDTPLCIRKFGLWGNESSMEEYTGPPVGSIVDDGIIKFLKLY